MATSKQRKERTIQTRFALLQLTPMKTANIHVPCEGGADRPCEAHCELDETVRGSKGFRGRCRLLNQYHAEPTDVLN